jgi:hypothetical protein
MRIKTAILVLAAVLSHSASPPVLGRASRAGGQREGLLRDGFALTGAEGKVSTHKGGDDSRYVRFEQDEVWLFELGVDVNDYDSVIRGGTKLQLLPSTALEKIIADVKEHPDGAYRLWGRITKYRGVNYIFPEFFLSVVKLGPVEVEGPVEPNEAAPPASEVREKPAEPNEPNKPAAQKEPNEPAKQTEPAKPTRAEEIELREALTDPNGVLKLPQEVLEKLKGKKIVVPRKIEPRAKPQDEVEKDSTPAKEPQKEPDKGIKEGAAPAVETRKEPEKEPQKAPQKEAEQPQRAAMKLDTVLADRTAVLVKQADGRFVFVLDAYGLSVGDISFRLLPCEALELTEARQVAELNAVRFKIAGIQTKYKGTDYLLLQKATRAYSHGNFGR